MEDIPKTVQWLLAFANLGCTPGVLNPQRCKTLNKFTELHRPPTEPPTNITSLKPGELPHTGLDLNRVIDENGYTWLRTWGKPVFLGKEDHYPTLQDFKTFFSKGLPHTKTDENVDIVIPSRDGDPSTFKLFFTECDRTQDKFYKAIEGEAYPFLKSMWDVSWACLTAIMQTTGNLGHFEREAREYIYWFFRTFKGAPLISDTLPMAVYAVIIDFWDNHRQLHPLVKQCVCGSFFVGDTGKKPKMFCTRRCGRVFHKQGRAGNSKSVSAVKKSKKIREKRNDFNAIRDFYKGAGYSAKNAEEHARKWVYTEGKTFLNFKKQEMR